jgi:hypothetical protein
MTVLLVVVVPLGCAGTKTFHQLARPLDTVAVAAGWKHHFTKNNITVEIQPADSGPSIFYPPNDPNVPVITNFYPDPLSSIILSRQTAQDLTPYAGTYAAQMSYLFTNEDKDWWQTVVFVNLPGSLPEGLTTIIITDPEGETATANLNIVAGTGQPHRFRADDIGALTDDELASLSRVGHYTVSFETTTSVPEAIQIDLQHDPDVDHSGAGRAYVVNPLGYIKNALWSNQPAGTGLRVILMPTRTGEITQMLDFKFYVAGGVTNLGIVDVQAFDVDGNPVTGVTATIN